MECFAPNSPAFQRFSNHFPTIFQNSNAPTFQHSNITMLSGRVPIRVAIAEDNTMFRKGIVDLLTRTSDKFEVVADAGNGQELLDLISRMEHHPDVCVLDDGMPVLDGFNTLVRLKEVYPLIKVLILTFNDNAIAVNKMLSSSANGYLLKEDEPEELKRAIEHVAVNDFYHSAFIESTLLSTPKSNAVEISADEQAFLKLCIGESAYKKIARQMGVSTHTAEGLRDELYRKLGVNTHTELVIYALKNGLNL